MGRKSSMKQKKENNKEINRNFKRMGVKQEKEKDIGEELESSIH